MFILHLFFLKQIFNEIDKKIEDLNKTIGGEGARGVIKNSGGINNFLFGDKGLDDRVKKLEINNND